MLSDAASRRAPQFPVNKAIEGGFQTLSGDMGTAFGLKRQP